MVGLTRARPIPTSSEMAPAVQLRLGGNKTRPLFHEFLIRTDSAPAGMESSVAPGGFVQELREGEREERATRSVLQMEEGLGSSSSAIDCSNIGFRLLKKQGWKEGTGLGIAEQGRLEPLQPHVKNNKHGLGAEKMKKKCIKLHKDSNTKEHNNNDNMASGKKAKTLSKRMRKLQEEEKRMQEKEFDRAFFREFWPDNV